MKTKILSFIAMALVLILNACSPSALQSPSAEPPAPVSEGVYQPVDIDQVEAEVGVGSPIPVFVIVSGNLPDSCAQVEFIQVLHDQSGFHITLSTIPSDAEGCVQDTLPFRIKLPLNVIGLPAGDHTVEVNNSRAGFSLDTDNAASTQFTFDNGFYKDDIEVDDLNIEIGQGSPIPVHAVVSLRLPYACAQLGEIRLHRDGTTFFVRLIAYVIEGNDCQADSIRFRAEIPLNIVNLPEGPYEVNVNGVTASFDLRAVPANSQQ